MTRTSFRILISALASVVAVSAAAQEPTPIPPPRRGGRVVPSQPPSNDDGARKVADRAIAELVAWKTTAARNILDGARQQYGETPEFKTALGLLRFNEGKAQDALNLLQAASAAAPADPAPEYLRGEVLQALKNGDAARTAWTKSRDRAKVLAAAEPKNARAQYYFGAALIRHEQPGPARTALTAAAQEGFDRRLTAFQTGLSRILEKQWDPAVEAFTAVITADDRFAPAYFYRGYVWSKLDRKDLMLSDFTRFLALAPTAPEADTARALMAAYSG